MIWVISSASITTRIWIKLILSWIWVFLAMPFNLGKNSVLDNSCAMEVSLKEVRGLWYWQCNSQLPACGVHAGASLKLHFDSTLGGLEAPLERELSVMIMIAIFIGLSMKKCQKVKEKSFIGQSERKVEAAPGALVPTTVAAIWWNSWGVQGVAGWPIHADWHFYWISDISCCCNGTTWKAGQCSTFCKLKIESKYSG